MNIQLDGNALFYNRDFFLAANTLIPVFVKRLISAPNRGPRKKWEGSSENRNHVDTSALSRLAEDHQPNVRPTPKPKKAGGKATNYCDNQFSRSIFLVLPRLGSARTPARKTLQNLKNSIALESAEEEEAQILPIPPDAATAPPHRCN